MEKLNEMARIGWIPSDQPRGIEVYVHTDDSGNIPHFHVRKYSSENKFEWEVCVRYDSPRYFEHGKYNGVMPTKVTKALDKMLRENNPKDPGRTYWLSAVIDWNRNNSIIELPLDIEQPNYTLLNHNPDDI